MNEFVPRGYISIREALNRVGRTLFRSDWTGEEHKAPSGLISEEEWLKNKDVPPPRGSGATGASPPVPAGPRSTGDPSDPSYQAEYRARQRYVAARDRLRVMLEAGDLEAAILDPWTGGLHQASAALWRQHHAGRLIDRGRAPLPGSSNTGSLLVKEFAEASAPTKPISRAQMAEVIRALQAKVATESLTRPQQRDFVRTNFPTYRITERQFSEIFRSVPVDPGRPKKSDKKL